MLGLLAVGVVSFTKQDRKVSCELFSQLVTQG